MLPLEPLGPNCAPAPLLVTTVVPAPPTIALPPTPVGPIWALDALLVTVTVLPAIGMRLS